MGVAEVPGYGPITPSNAKEIYAAWRKGQVDLSPSQQKYAESFLTQEERDEVSYDSDVAQKDGSDKINTDGADKKQGGNVAATTAGNIASILATVTMGKVTAIVGDGFTAAIVGAAMVATASASLISTNKFDSAYNERTAANDAGDETNATIDGAANALLESMDYMNEDMELYQAQSEEYTLMVNDSTSTLADLQVQLASAQSAGDTAGAENIRSQIESLKGQDFSGQQDEMDETRGRLEEYQMAADESLGISSAGTTVADFLGQGTVMGAMAIVNTAILLTGATLMGLAAAGHFPKIYVLGVPIDMPASIAAKIELGMAGAIFGAAAGIMSAKAVKEFECASKGSDIEDHVTALNDMIGEQQAYIDTTTETFDATDEESSESQAEAQETANEAVANDTAAFKSKGKDENNDENKAGAAA